VSNVNIPLPGYTSAGADAVRLKYRGDHFFSSANNNYTAGGYNINASTYGLSAFEEVDAGTASFSNSYFVRVFYPNTANTNETQASAYATVLLKWYYVNNSNELGSGVALSDGVRLSATGI
jgi:hypothetical protein